jgi:hypothetical protein
MDAVIKAQTITVNVSPFGFRHWAKHYLACRNSFVPPDEGFSPVPYFLDCRAIELELKARHLETKSRREVKDLYGHNLERSFQNLPKEGQALSPGELRVLQAANNIYMGKGFEYFNVLDAVYAFKKFPPLAQLDAITRKLVPA